MSVVQLKFYSGDDPNGSLLGTLDDSQLTAPKGQTKFECRVALRGFGSGQFSISQSHPSATSSLIRKGNYVRVVIPSIQEDPVWGFWLWEGDFSLLDINGNDTLTFKGPGPLGILRDAVLKYESQVPDQPARGSANHDDVWWWINEPYGAILTRIIEEGRYAPFPDPAVAGSPLEPVTIDFDRVNDSASNPWPNIDGEYQQPIWANVLSVFEDLRDAGDMFVVSDPDFLIQAFQTYGTDRTSTSFAAGKVRITDTNILTGLSKHIHASQEGTHFGGRSKDGDYYTEIHPDYTSGRERWITGDAPETNDDTLLSKLGQEALAQSTRNTDAFEAEITPGDDELNGRYLPWLHYNVGDYPTVDAGAGSYAYVDDDARIIAFRVVLAEASDDSTDDTAHRSLHTVLELNAASSEGAPSEGRAVGTPGCRCLYLCRPGILAEPITLFRYTSLTNAMTANPAIDAGWGGGTSEVPNQLTASPADTRDGVLNSTNVGQRCFSRFAIELDSVTAPLIAAGGLTFLMHARARTRAGVGINESAQDMISQECLYVTVGDSTTKRGTALAMHGLTSSAGSTKWNQSSTLRNTAWPPAAATNALSPVPGTVAGDFLVIEVGVANFTPGGEDTGSHIYFNDQPDAAGDLPADESTTTNLRSWIQITSGGGLLSTVNDGHPDLIGTGTRAKRCSDTEHFFSDRAPTADDDFDTAGMRYGTHWVQVDDLENPTESFGSWMLIDTTEGAAVWIQMSTGTSGTEEHTHDPLEIIRTVADHGPMGTTETFDATDGEEQAGEIDDDVTITVTGSTAGIRSWMTLELYDDGAGPHDLTWVGVTWPGGIPPEPPAAGETLVVTLLSDIGATTFFGSYPGVAGSSLEVTDETTTVTDVVGLEFDPADFDVTDETGGVARVSFIGSGGGGGVMPLTAVVDDIPTLVWDEDDSLIPVEI